MPVVKNLSLALKWGFIISTKALLATPGITSTLMAVLSFTNFIAEHGHLGKDLFFGFPVLIHQYPHNQIFWKE